MSAIKTVTAVINGVSHVLTYNSSTGAYEASITAPTNTSWPLTDHVYPITVTAEDVAGNTATVNPMDATFGSKLKLRVKETVKPVVSFVTPTDGAGLTNNKPTFTVKVTDTGSGVDLSTFTMSIDGGTAIKIADCTKTAITNGYNITYTPSTALSDGNHTITASVGDYDGNTSATAQVTIKIDTVPPVLNVTGPDNNSFTNVVSCVVEGATNDEASSPVTLKVQVNDGTPITVDVGDDGAFRETVNLTEGVNTIKIVSTDSLGKYTEVTRTVTLDTAAPVFTEVSVAPNPVDCGATYKISVKVTS